MAFLDGNSMKQSMHGFLTALQSIDPASIGMNLPTDDFYYTK